MLLVPFIAGLAGLGCAFFGIFIPANAKAIDSFSYWQSGPSTPMFLVAGTFFPLDELPTWAQVASLFNPLYHCVELVRTRRVRIRGLGGRRAPHVPGRVRSLVVAARDHVHGAKADPVTTNRRWLLTERPSGIASREHFEWVEEPVPEIGDGELLVRTLWISGDPTQRGWMERDTYMPKRALGEVMGAGGVARWSSKDAAYAPGDLVSGDYGWQDYAVAPRAFARFFRRSSSRPGSIRRRTPLFGITGLTAYFGLLEVGAPIAGETVVVSGAAGAAGIAGQIAKVKGCRVIGIAGGDAKCDSFAWSSARRRDRLQGRGRRPAASRACPKGIDVYFDNVGGAILDAVLANLAMHARIVLCGAIAEYNGLEERYAARELQPAHHARAGRWKASSSSTSGCAMEAMGELAGVGGRG